MTGKPGGIRAAIVLLLLIPVLVPLFAALAIWLGEREPGVASNDRVQAAARLASADWRCTSTSTRATSSARWTLALLQLSPD